MKKLYTVVCLISATFGGYLLYPTRTTAYPSGSSISANYSGIPGGLTCTNCHGGGVNAGPGSVGITTTIPGTGYVGGQTYSVSVTVTSGGSNGVLYGFSCSSTKQGTSTISGKFVAADATTLAKAGGNYIVHNTAAAGNGNPSHTFTFNWTAPVTGTGPITFYAAGNSANGNNENTGDNIYNANIQVTEAPGAGLTESVVDHFNLYPNPATESVTVNVPQTLVDSQVRILDVTGKTVFNRQLTTENMSVDVSTLTHGLYVVEIQKGGKSYTTRLVKN